MNFRNYNGAAENVKEHYKKLRSQQTVSYVEKMRTKYPLFSTKMNIWDCFTHLEKFIDISDPDINLPNCYHLFQTAESIRKDGHPDWLQVTGLLHDLGKIMYLYGTDEEGTTIKEQWGITGDTFVIGCKIPNTCIYPEYNDLNPDMHNPKYNTSLGIYQPNCGLDNCLISSGHDEYLYQVLKFNQCKLPEEGLYIIRYHSLYPWHKESEYSHLMNEKDRQNLKWVKLFNKYDLYSKRNEECDLDELKKYYEKLLDKYVGKFLFF